MLMKNYHIEEENKLISPALIYYYDGIIQNTVNTIKLAGGVERLWPHVKTHKTVELIKNQIAMGITRFKCATIPEAEIAALGGAKHVLLSYPLIGPNVARFISITKGMPKTKFWAMGDNLESLQLLSSEATNNRIKIPVVLDVNVGMNRTGIPLQDVETFYKECFSFSGLTVQGLHCYDGHNCQADLLERQTKVDKCVCSINKVRDSIIRQGFSCDTMIMGGTPSFACHAKANNYYLYGET